MGNELAPRSLVRPRPSTEPIRCASRWLLPSLGLRGGSLLGGQSPTIRAVVVISNMIFDSHLREGLGEAVRVALGGTYDLVDDALLQLAGRRGKWLGDPSPPSP